MESRKILKGKNEIADYLKVRPAQVDEWIKTEPSFPAEQRDGKGSTWWSHTDLLDLWCLRRVELKVEPSEEIKFQWRDGRQGPSVSVPRKLKL